MPDDYSDDLSYYSSFVSDSDFTGQNNVQFVIFPIIL